MTDDTSDVWIIKLSVPDLPEADHHQLKGQLMHAATEHRSFAYALMPTGHTFRFRGRHPAAAFHACIAEALPSGSTVIVEAEDPMPDYVVNL